MNAMIVRTLKNSNKDFKIKTENASTLSERNSTKTSIFIEQPNTPSQFVIDSPKAREKMLVKFKIKRNNDDNNINNQSSENSDLLSSEEQKSIKDFDSIKNKPSNLKILALEKKDARSSNGSCTNLNSKLHRKQPFSDSRVINSKTNIVSRKVTKMLIVLSTTFLLLNLPIHSFNIYINIRILATKIESYYPIEYDLNEIAHSIFYTSFSVNFFLYNISGVSFRTELRNLIFKVFRI
jgi:hypothetical protein